MKQFCLSLCIALSLTVLSLTGCGGGSGSDSDDSSTADLKVLHLPMRSNGPNVIDPVRGSTVYDNRICCQVYEPLLEYAYLDRPIDARTLEPLLLAEMPQVSEDGLTYHFKLKEGVMFHDDECFPDGKGREMVTDDVFYSWKRMADDDNEPKSWWLLENTIVGFDEFREAQNNAKTFDYDAPVEGFKKINDYEFEVTLKEPVYRFQYVLAMFQTAVVPREAVDHYKSEFGINPVGTGPFTLEKEDFEVNKRVVLNKNPAYHKVLYPEMPEEDYEGKDRDIELGFYKDAGKQLPLVDRVEITMYQQDAPMWLKFKSKELDYIQVPAENFADAFNVRKRELLPAYKKEGIVSHAVPLLDFIFIGFNMEDELVGGYTEEKKALRQAICMSLDWDERNESFYNGINIIYDGPIPPGMQGHPEDGNAEVSYRGPDLEKARELLAKAGYPNAEGLPTIDYYTSKSANIPEQTDMLERQLSEVGIKINKNLVDFSQLIEFINKKKATMFAFAWASDYPDGENNLALFYGPYESPGSNHFNYKRDEFDKLYEQIRTMGPTEERGELYEKMRDMVVEDAAYAGSMARTRFYMSNPRLKNFKPTETFYGWLKYMNVEEGED